MGLEWVLTIALLLGVVIPVLCRYFFVLGWEAGLATRHEWSAELERNWEEKLRKDRLMRGMREPAP